MATCLKERLRKALKDKIKNEALAKHFELIDTLLSVIANKYPQVDIESLTIQLAEVVEQIAESEATMTLKFQDEIQAIIQSAVDSAKQVSVAA